MLLLPLFVVVRIVRFLQEKAPQAVLERRGSIVERLSMTVEVKTITKIHQTSLIWQPDGDRIYFGCNDGSVCLCTIVALLVAQVDFLSSCP